MDIDEADNPVTGFTPSLSYGRVQINARETNDGVFHVSRQILAKNGRSYEPRMDEGFLFIASDGTSKLEDTHGNVLIEEDDWRTALKGWPL